MPYVVLLKTGFYLSKSEKTQADIKVKEMEKAKKFLTKQEASSALRSYTQDSTSFETGTIQKIKNK